MKLSFIKMHGIGNDFVILNQLINKIDLQNFPVKKLSHRQLGIGFDQLLVILPATNADFACRIFNADGMEAEQCGNGLRCVARYLYDQGIAKTKNFSIATKAGIFSVVVDKKITITMGIPKIQHSVMDLMLPQQKLQASIISMGNPHAIIKTSDINSIPICEIGTAINQLAQFPEGVNVGFMQIINRNQVQLRTFERGIGETFACGSNACAAVAAGINENSLANEVIVHFKYGTLTIFWQGKNTQMQMSGDAQYTFQGEIEI